MEIAKVEVEAIEKAVRVILETEVIELAQLDLAMVGGGTGAVSLG